MIYLAKFCNFSFSLLFSVQAEFSIYNNNLSSLHQIYTNLHKLYYFNNNFQMYQIISFWFVLEYINQVLSFLQVLLCCH